MLGQVHRCIEMAPPALGNEDAKRVADSRLVSPALLPSRARTAPALTRSPFGPRGLAWVALGVERRGSAAPDGRRR